MGGWVGGRGESSTVVEATPCAGPGQTLQAGAEASPLALVFLAPLRPYALRTFAVAPPAAPAPPAPAARRPDGDEVVVENEHVRVTFSAITGLMTGARAQLPPRLRVCVAEGSGNGGRGESDSRQPGSHGGARSGARAGFAYEGGVPLTTASVLVTAPASTPV